jgi:Flp pilus assembly protein TadB
VLGGDGLGTIMLWLLPAGASFLTTRYWTARDDGDPRRHLWFAFFLVAVVVMVVGVLASTPPEDRTASVALFFAVLVGATALQERRHRRRARYEARADATPEPPAGDPDAAS